SNAVTWSINPQVGSIDQTGLYTAPGILTVSQKVTASVTSVADPTKSASAVITLTPLVTVGAGAPTDALVQLFQSAWNRVGLNALVAMPPVANVRAFGNAGYVQEFNAADGSTLRHALVTGSASLAYAGTSPVFQVLGPLWSYYSTVGANTAGYPLGDSQA